MGNWIFELNEIWGELKFLKSKGGGGGGGGTWSFEIFNQGEFAGDETSNRKQNFTII